MTKQELIAALNELADLASDVQDSLEIASEKIDKIVNKLEALPAEENEIDDSLIKE